MRKKDNKQKIQIDRRIWQVRVRFLVIIETKKGLGEETIRGYLMIYSVVKQEVRTKGGRDKVHNTEESN